MQACISSDVSGQRVPPLKSDVIGLGAGPFCFAYRARSPCSRPPSGIPRHGLLCDSLAASIQATTVLPRPCLRATCLLGQAECRWARQPCVNDAGGAWAAGVGVVTKTSVICAKAQPPARSCPRRHPRGLADRTAAGAALGRVDVVRGSSILRRPEAQMQCRVSELPRWRVQSRLTDLAVTGPEALASSRAWHHALQS